MTDSTLQTEFEFTLPKGYVDDDGTLHKEGRMRLATAADEIKPLKDPRVQENASYLTIILLSRVVTQLGSLDRVTPEVIESLFVSDLEYLQEMYERVNDGGTDLAEVGGAPAGGDVGDGPTGRDADDTPAAADGLGSEVDAGNRPGE